MRRALAAAGFATVLLATSARAGDDVAVNGFVVPKATSTIEVTQDVTEFRSGTDPNPLLLPGAKRYGVCIVAPAPVALLDAELPRSDTATRYPVQIEDGRTFGNCLVTSLKTDGSGGKRRLTYCLRCENVTTP